MSIQSMQLLLPRVCVRVVAVVVRVVAVVSVVGIQGIQFKYE